MSCLSLSSSSCAEIIPLKTMALGVGVLKCFQQAFCSATKLLGKHLEERTGLHWFISPVVSVHSWQLHGLQDGGEANHHDSRNM